jgi:hypothetical protein
MSHLIAAHAIVKLNLPHALIFEDDAELATLFYPHFDFAWAHRFRNNPAAHLYQLGVQLPRRSIDNITINSHEISSDRKKQLMDKGNGAWRSCICFVV